MYVMYFYRCDKAELELKMKGEMFEEKEVIWKGHIEDAERNAGEMNDKLKMSVSAAAAAAAGPSATSQAEMLELKMKLTTQTKANQVLRIDLKSSEMQLNMKTKIDEGKSKLVELLDKKVTQLDTKNKELRGLLEGAVKDRETTAEKMEDLGGDKDLSQQLADSEKAYQDVKMVNKELRQMLNELEEKSKKIAMMAKEKVLKYVDQNKILQENIVSLTQQLQDAQAGLPVATVIDDSHKSKLMEELEHLRKSLDEKDSQLKKLEAELHECKLTTENIKFQREESDILNPIKMMKADFEQLKQKIEARDDEIVEGATVELIPAEAVQGTIQQLENEKQLVMDELEEIAKKEKELLVLNEVLGEKLKVNEGEMIQMKEELAGMKGMLTLLEKEIDGPPNDGQNQVARNA